MAREKHDNPQGLLHRTESEKLFHLSRYVPDEPLDVFLEHYWIVRWDLSDREPYVQENLPHPSVHMVFEPGASNIYGVVTGKFTRRLVGKGKVLGIKFRPGGFRAFLRAPVASITNRIIPIESVFSVDAHALEARVLSCDEDDDMIAAAAAAVFATGLPDRDEDARLAERVVAMVQEDRRILTVEQLARRAGLGKRALQRLFNEYVGVSPKWVIARCRLFEAADALTEGRQRDLARVAIDLGYYDQAHFSRDFKRIVGFPPAEYARSARNGNVTDRAG